MLPVPELSFTCSSRVGHSADMPAITHLPKMHEGGMSFKSTLHGFRDESSCPRTLAGGQKPPARWAGGRAASGGSELHGVTAAALRFLRCSFSRGGHRAAVSPARRAVFAA